MTDPQEPEQHFAQFHCFSCGETTREPSDVTTYQDGLCGDCFNNPDRKRWWKDDD